MDEGSEDEISIEEEDEAAYRAMFLEKWKLDEVIDYTILTHARKPTTEVCRFGDQQISIPVAALQNVSNLASIFSMETWNTCLSEAEREKLRAFLPATSKSQQEDLLKDLFNPQTNFHFGNPTQKFAVDLNCGQYNAAIVKYKEQITFLQQKNHLLNMQTYQTSLARKLLENKQNYGFKIEKELSDYLTNGPMKALEPVALEYLTRKKQKKEKKRKRKLFGSDKTYEAQWYKFMLSSGSDSEHSDTDNDSDVAPSSEDEDYSEFMRKAKRHKQYKNKKKERISAQTSNEKKTKEKTTPGKDPKKAANGAAAPAATITPVAASTGVQSNVPIFMLFTAIREFFGENNQTANLTQLCEATQAVSCLTMTIPPQYSLRNFVDLALHFLAQPPRLPQQAAGQSDIFVLPFIAAGNEANQWVWKAADSPEIADRLESLEQLFFFAATRKKLECDDKGRVQIPFTLIKQQKCQVTIPATSAYAITLYHNQEKERFDDYGKAFTFEIQGVKSIVSPLRGTNNPMLKARDHALLVANRPAHINLLSLVRNAAARLPGGVGTRADVAHLMKDSQYVVSGSSDQKINQVVSGALDRLQSTSDPPVKFDPDQKLWIYRHRLRSPTDFSEGAADM